MPSTLPAPAERRGENQNQETSLTKSCEAVSEMVMATAVGPTLSQTFLCPGPRGLKLIMRKCADFHRNPGQCSKNKPPLQRGRIYGCNRIIPHSIFPSTALLQEAVHIQARRARRFESGPPSS